jgi:hypothetical protein
MNFDASLTTSAPVPGSPSLRELGSSWGTVAGKMSHSIGRAASRCVFWICHAICSGGLSPLPDVPPSVCYPSGRHRQRRRPKPGGQRSLDPRIGRERVSRLGDCQHHGGREPADRDMVNRHEVPIKVVNSDKPKMLSGLNQNGMWSGTGALHSPVADGVPPADRHDLNPE